MAWQAIRLLRKQIFIVEEGDERRARPRPVKLPPEPGPSDWEPRYAEPKRAGRAVAETVLEPTTMSPPPVPAAKVETAPSSTAASVAKGQTQGAKVSSRGTTAPLARPVSPKSAAPGEAGSLPPAAARPPIMPPPAPTPPPPTATPTPTPTPPLRSTATPTPTPLTPPTAPTAPPPPPATAQAVAPAAAQKNLVELYFDDGTTAQLPPDSHLHRQMVSAADHLLAKKPRAPWRRVFRRH